MTTDASQAAQHLRRLVSEKGYLDHGDAIVELERHFDDDAIVINDAGNQAIAPKILAAFRSITKDTVVWDRADRIWRSREANDMPGRKQV